MQCMEPELGFFLRFGMLTPSAASGRLSELLGFPISCPSPLSTLVRAMVVEVGSEIEQFVFQIFRRPEQHVIQILASKGAD
jgi:hypothetical protein